MHSRGRHPIHWANVRWSSFVINFGIKVVFHYQKISKVRNYIFPKWVGCNETYEASSESHIQVLQHSLISIVLPLVCTQLPRDWRLIWTRWFICVILYFSLSRFHCARFPLPHYKRSSSHSKNVCLLITIIITNCCCYFVILLEFTGNFYK